MTAWLTAHPYLFFLGCAAWLGTVMLVLGVLGIGTEIDERSTRWVDEQEGRREGYGR